MVCASDDDGARLRVNRIQEHLLGIYWTEKNRRFTEKLVEQTLDIANLSFDPRRPKDSLPHAMPHRELHQSRDPRPGSRRDVPPPAAVPLAGTGAFR